MQSAFPKCPICDSTNGYELSGILGKYAECRICMAKWQFFIKNKQISKLKLHELPKDGSSIFTILSTKEPLFTTIGKHLPIDFWKNLKLDKKVNWEFLSLNINPNVSNAVITQEREKLLHQWDGTRQVREKVVLQGTSMETTKSEAGVLLLSNQKLRWMKKRQSGFWTTVVSFLVVDEIQLEDIKGISGDTGDSDEWSLPKKISIVDSKGEKVFNVKYAFLESFKPMVENAIEVRRKDIAMEKKKERLHVMLDFSFLNTYMETGGLIMKALKCPECGAKIEFPKTGTETKCTYCGCTILAQDVFEKVKSLLE